MTYSHGDIHTLSTSRAVIDIPDLPIGEPEDKFIVSIRNLNASLSADVWLTNGGVRNRIPPNFDGVLYDALPYQHIKDGLEGQGIGGSVDLNIVILEQVEKPSVVSNNVEQQAVITQPTFEDTPDLDTSEIEVESVIVG